MDSSRSASAVSWAARRRKSSPRAMTQKRRRRAPKKGAGDTEMSRCGEAESKRAEPLGRREGKPPGRPWQARSTTRAARARGARPETTAREGDTGADRREARAREPGRERSPRRGLDVQVQGGREFRHGPACAYLPCTASPNLQCDARVQPVENDFSRGNVAFARDGFTERAQNGQRVGVRSPIGAPHDRRKGDVLPKEGSQVGAIVFQLGPHPGLCAVGASLKSVWRANGHVQRFVGIAQG